ncbi:hypothetical protein MKX33_00595 [Paenibacillus sp. FSL R5-0490]|uniref:hypothetical protein n=1 Tax=Paenibacillus sp. FSL R5-0490 TaxID=1920424 RepID=UPI0030D4E26E
MKTYLKIVREDGREINWELEPGKIRLSDWEVQHIESMLETMSLHTVKPDVSKLGELKEWEADSK